MLQEITLDMSDSMCFSIWQEQPTSTIHVRSGTNGWVKTMTCCEVSKIACTAWIFISSFRWVGKYGSSYIIIPHQWIQRGCNQPQKWPPRKKRTDIEWLKGDLRASQPPTTNQGLSIQQNLSILQGSFPAFAARRARQAFWQNLAWREKKWWRNMTEIRDFAIFCKISYPFIWGWSQTRQWLYNRYWGSSWHLSMKQFTGKMKFQ